MIQKIKRSLMILASVATFAMPALVPAAVYAAPCSDAIQQNLNSGVNTATGGTGGCDGTVTADGGALKNIATKIVNVFSIIVGIVAVIFIIYGGFRYITSGGESGNITSAKNTLIYALIGLVIVALAQFIVRVVLNTASNATTG